MPDRSRADYLRDLDGVLPFPDERRAEIVEEIATHLDDAVADGLTEEAAQRRLGDPVNLARDLARPEQSAWRVLAGVGVALRSGIGHGLYGYLLGILLVLVGTLGLTAIVQLLGAWLGTGWSLMTSDAGWSTLLTAVAMAIGLTYAGRVMPVRLALASRRLERDVRRPVVVVATALVAALTVVVMDVPQNWASVVGLVLAPGAIALGAYRPDLVPTSLRHYAAVAVLALVLPVGLLMATGGGSVTGGVVDEVAGPPDQNLGHVGPWWPPAADTYGAVESGGWSSTDAGIRWDATFGTGALDDLHGLRLEAWHADEETLAIDVRHREPFATALPTRSGQTLTATIRTTDEPGVTFWTLVLTGVGPDGTRYVVDAGSGGQSTFHGSVVDWVAAVIGD